MTIRKVSPYEAHLTAAADEVIRLRGLVAWMRGRYALTCVGVFALGLLAGLAV